MNVVGGYTDFHGNILPGSDRRSRETGPIVRFTAWRWSAERGGQFLTPSRSY